MTASIPLRKFHYSLSIFVSSLLKFCLFFLFKTLNNSSETILNFESILHNNSIAFI